MGGGEARERQGEERVEEERGEREGEERGEGLEEPPLFRRREKGEGGGE